MCRQCSSACAEGVSGESSPGSKERREEKAKEGEVRAEVSEPEQTVCVPRKEASWHLRLRFREEG